MNNPSLQKRVDTYIENTFMLSDDMLQFAIKNSKKHNLPPIQITPVIGKFLYLHAKSLQAKNVLEIGTLGGYSTLWLAKALDENGKIITIEHNQTYAAVAQNNFEYAKKTKQILIKIGDAQQILKTLDTKFDFIFIDANKEEYKSYMELSLKLSHSGTMIICDNVIRNGGVIEKKPEKEYYRLLADFNNFIATDARLDSTIVPLTIPLKDRDYIDGLSISIVV